jgi:hypothetical protein
MKLVFGVNQTRQHLGTGEKNRKMTQPNTTEKEERRHNRRLAKKRVQCLNEALFFVSSSVLSDSLVLRNTLLRQAQNR